MLVWLFLSCSGPSQVDAGVVIRAGQSWGNVQSPVFWTSAPGTTTHVLGRLWVDGGTEAAGAMAGVSAQVGVGPTGTDPLGSGWTWTDANFRADVDGRDEYTADLVTPGAGVYDVAYRYQLEPQAAWTPADRSDERRVGTDDGYQSHNAAKLAVPMSGATLKVAQQNLHCINDEPAARLDVIAARYVELGVDAVTLQEACIDPVLGNTADLLATKLTALTGHAWRAFFEQTHYANNVTPEGVAVVTWLPVATWSRTDLPSLSLGRGTLQVVVASPVGIVSISTEHFSFEATSQGAEDRLNQARAVVAFEAVIAPKVVAQVVAGDLNTSPGDPSTDTIIAAGFTDSWAATNAASVPGATFPASGPIRRIDYIFVKGLTPVSTSREFRNPDLVSDHLGVVAVLAAP